MLDDPSASLRGRRRRVSALPWAFSAALLLPGCTTWVARDGSPGGDADDDACVPGSELCDGLDNDCDPETDDGDDECSGFCCGDPPACRTCCDAAQCGPGDWTCTDLFDCACYGIACGDVCHDPGDCCSPTDCGVGGWTCPGNVCTCTGSVCGDGFCATGSACCVGGDCGAGDWDCLASHACSCGGVVCSGTCYDPGECCHSGDCPSSELCVDHICT